jgi:hypothetical protein
MKIKGCLAALAAMVCMSAVPYALASAPAMVSDEIVFSPRTGSKVKYEYSLKLLAIDGQQVEREPIAKYRDVRPKALVPEGEHLFKVSVHRVVHTTDEAEKQVEFRASVRAGSSYMLGGTEEKPVLIDLAEATRMK